MIGALAVGGFFLVAIAFRVGWLVGESRARRPEPAPTPEALLRRAKIEAQMAEVSVGATKHVLERTEVERLLVRETLELEADRLKGHAALEGVRAESDAQLSKIESARSSPELAAGDVVRTRRSELGLTQYRLSDLSGISVRRISDIESGRGGTDRDLRVLASQLDLRYHPAALTRPERAPTPVRRSLTPELPRGHEDEDPEA